jgi:hypothetical protein
MRWRKSLNRLSIMSRQSRRKVERLEGLVKSTAAVRKQRNAEFWDSWRKAAREHAAKLVALFLYGEPQLDEPLEASWSRAMLHLDLDHRGDWLIASQLQRLVARLPGGEDEAAKLAAVFSTLPNWLLSFCMAPRDAFLLGFKLPAISDAPLTQLALGSPRFA